MAEKEKIKTMKRLIVIIQKFFSVTFFKFSKPLMLMMLFNFGSNRTILDLLEDFTLHDFLDDQLTCGKINLRKYINENVRNYAKYVKNSLKDLGFNSKRGKLKNFKITPQMINTIKKNIPNFDLSYLISTKGKIKYQWWGYTYELRDNYMKEFQVGYSTLPGDKRLNYYLKAMFFNPKYRFYATGQETIYNRMFEHVKSNGLKNFINPNTNYPNFKKIKNCILKRFEFKITGVYFSEYATKRAEDKQILLGKKKGNALNKCRGGAGSKSFNSYLRFIITYISLGYSIAEIIKKLQKNHGLNWKINRLNISIEIFFGNIHNARKLFLHSLFNLLRQKGFTEVEIYENFKHYFDGKTTRREFSNIDTLILLIKKGHSRNYIASYFKMGISTFEERIKEFISEYYPFLEVYLDRIDKAIPTFMDLKYYLIANEICNLMIISKGKISKDEIVQRFRENCKDDPDFYLHPRQQLLSIIKKVFKMDFETLNYHVKAKFLYDIITKRNPYNIRQLYFFSTRKTSSDYYRYNPIANTLRNVFIDPNSKTNFLLKIKANDLRKSDVIEIFELTKIAIIAEVLENGYRLRYSTIQIAKSSNLFKSKEEVELYTKNIFGCILDPDKFPFERHLLEKFGVRKFEFSYN